MLSPRELVIQERVIPDYLEGLRVVQSAIPLSSTQRYLLARHRLDCHDLSLALHHHSYRINPAAPIMVLAAQTFEGFKEFCGVEGGYSTIRIARFFEENGDASAP